MVLPYDVGKRIDHGMESPMNSTWEKGSVPLGRPRMANCEHQSLQIDEIVLVVMKNEWPLKP